MNAEAPRALDPTRPTLCLSDLHLTDSTSPPFITLTAVAALAASEGLNLLLLGDIVEVWVGDDDDAPLAQAFRALLARTAQQTAVGLMAGNRDFLYGTALGESTGVTLLDDPLRFGNTLLSHGDAYCVDDAPYQELRALFRSEAWQADILSQSLEQRRHLARGLREQSAAANGLKAKNIMDVNADAWRTALADAGCDDLVHGHTHRPGIHRDGQTRRTVLGDWHETAWIAVLCPGIDPALFCLAFGQPLDPWWAAVKAQLNIRLDDQRRLRS